MEIKLKNENKMKRYLSWRINRKITEDEFKNCIGYFEEMTEFILEQRENKPLIRERSCEELEINNEDYEVWVTYDSVIENGKQLMYVDFDYSYDEFIDSLTFDVY